ncbi:MAG: hypothetical protein LBP19_10475 [Treponema sp.]|nr:hypothetical protein [Treponema sp.]
MEADIFNLMDRVQAIFDGILTEKGITGAVNIGKELRDMSFNAVYANDLKRQLRRQGLRWSRIAQPKVGQSSKIRNCAK